MSRVGYGILFFHVCGDSFYGLATDLPLPSVLGEILLSCLLSGVANIAGVCKVSEWQNISFNTACSNS